MINCLLVRIFKPLVSRTQHHNIAATATEYKSSSFKKSSTMQRAATFVLLLVAMFVVMASVMDLAEGRYLPTRSDEARFEELRAFLRELLEGPRGFDKSLLVKRAAEM